jgi:hypothetical protein
MMLRRLEWSLRKPAAGGCESMVANGLAKTMPESVSVTWRSVPVKSQTLGLAGMQGKWWRPVHFKRWAKIGILAASE